MPIVPVYIAKLGEDVDIDPDKVPEEIYTAIWTEGAKAFMSRGLAKITTKGKEGQSLEDAREEVRTQVQKNLEAIYDGTIRVVGRRTEKVAGGERAVMSEAKKMAVARIKQLMRKRKMKIKDVKPADLREAAKTYLTSDGGKELIEKARVVVAAKAKEIEASSEEAGLQELVAGLQRGDTKGGTLSATQARLPNRR